MKGKNKLEESGPGATTGMILSLRERLFENDNFHYLNWFLYISLDLTYVVYICFLCQFQVCKITRTN